VVKINTVNIGGKKKNFARLAPFRRTSSPTGEGDLTLAPGQRSNWRVNYFEQ